MLILVNRDTHVPYEVLSRTIGMSTNSLWYNLLRNVTGVLLVGVSSRDANFPSDSVYSFINGLLKLNSSVSHKIK